MLASAACVRSRTPLVALAVTVSTPRSVFVSCGCSTNVCGAMLLVRLPGICVVSRPLA